MSGDGPGLIHTEEVTGSIPVSPTQLTGRFLSEESAVLSGGSSKRQQRSGEADAELAQGVTSGIGRGLGVDLHRHGNLAVPEDAHRDWRVNIERGQQRGAGLCECRGR